MTNRKTDWVSRILLFAFFAALIFALADNIWVRQSIFA